MPEGHRRRRREACWTATSTAASSPQKDADYQDPAPFIRGSSPPLTSPGGSDETMAETQLNQARASLVTAQSRLSYTVVKAPVAGVLISRNVERGWVVQPSNVLMKLSPSGETQLIVDADE
jgi:multidrug efflux pump subunit AcrA (membrane-fusion protein)